MINRLGHFYALTVVVFLPLCAAAILLLKLYGEEGSAASLFYGSLVSLVLLAGTVSISLKMMTKNQNTMLIFVFGGMLVRMVVVLAVSVLAIKLLDFKLLYFFSGLFGSYILLQVFELVHLHKRLVK